MAACRNLHLAGRRPRRSKIVIRPLRGRLFDLDPRSLPGRTIKIALGANDLGERVGVSATRLDAELAQTFGDYGILGGVTGFLRQASNDRLRRSGRR